jgi:hypothetical protein
LLGLMLRWMVCFCLLRYLHACITKFANAGCSKNTVRVLEQFKMLQYYRAKRGEVTYHRPLSICFAML